MRTKRSRVRRAAPQISRPDDAPRLHSQQQQQQPQPSIAVDLLGDDTDDLLLVAANLLLREDASDRFKLPAVGVDFSSFQALLEAATTSTPDVKCEDDDDDRDAARARTDRGVSSAAYSKNRRERNRISCRKTRVKRKTEQARADLVARKRAEHGEFLSQLHLELTAQRVEGSEGERMARHLVVRSAHLGLMDPEYDASWCFTPASQAADSADARFEMAAQWRAITAAFAVADLSILQIRDDGGDSASCKWCVTGTPMEQLQDGSSRSEQRNVAGVTHVRFRDRLVASVEMRVSNSSAFDVAV